MRITRASGSVDPGTYGPDTVVTVASSGATETLTVPASGSLSEVLTLDANCTISIDTGAAPAGKEWNILLTVRQDSTGARTLTWPASVVWPSNTPPTLTATPSRSDMIALNSQNDGVTWKGALVGSDYPVPAVPAAPDLTATAGDTQVVLTWPSVIAAPSVTGYKVYRGTSSGGETLLTTLGNVLTYTDTGRTNGTTYYYKISAVNALGEGALSTEKSATPAAAGLPSIASGTLQARFAADMIDSPPSSGSAIASWEDESGNSRTASQATGSKQPLFITNAVNSKPVVRFDGTDDILQSTYTWPADNISVFVVAKRTGSATNQALVGSAAAAGLELRENTTGAISALKQNTAVIATSTSTVTAAAFHVIALAYTGDTGAGNHTWHITTDGTDDTGSASGGNSSLTTGIAATIGGAITAGTAADLFGGDIAEVLIYTGTSGSGGVTAADRKSIEQYLGAKYGITVAP